MLSFALPLYARRIGLSLSEIGVLLSLNSAVAIGPASAQTNLGSLQDDAVATYAPRLMKEDSHVDWARSARDIHNQIRGLHLLYNHPSLEITQLVLDKLNGDYRASPRKGSTATWRSPTTRRPRQTSAP